MKKLSIFILSLFSLSISAQKIAASSTTEKFSTGKQDALSTLIYEADIDKVVDAWKDFLKNFKSEKVKGSKSEVVGDNVLIPDWGNNTVDIYAVFKEQKKENAVEIIVAFDLGGAYLNSSVDSDKQQKAKKMLVDFSVKTTKNAYTDKIKDEEKIFSKQEDKQKRLEKENTDLNDDIKEYEQKITKSQKALIKNESDINQKKREVDAQKKVVNASSGAVSEQAKSSQKIYDKLESQLNDLEKEKKDLNKEIEEYREKISKAEKDIKENEENQKKSKEELETQKKKIEFLNDKLKKVD
jgi:septal ring factor EnvC (AmiA/AmiB activator)